MTSPIVRRQITGGQLRRTRERAGLSQTAVAERLGVRPQRVGNLEREASPTQDACLRVLSVIAELAAERDSRP